jgi:predicted nucleic acid-binding protein
VTSRRFVVDSSPLILLAKIEALELMERLADEVAVPATVPRGSALFQPLQQAPTLQLRACE